MSSPYLFIVTPSYNQGHFIKQTIDSVLKQNYPNLVYWVMDGGSTDSTVKVLKSYGKKLNWVSEKDKGQTDALNKGIAVFKKLPKEVQKDAIFAYINSDDYYTLGSFKKVVKLVTQLRAERGTLDVWVPGECQITSDKAAVVHSAINDLWKKFLTLIFSKNTLLIANPIAQPATFISWSLVKKTGSFNASMRYAFDYEYWLRLVERSMPHFLPQPLAVFRIQASAKGSTQFRKQFEEQYQTAKKFTTSPLLLGLHRMHNALAILLYSVAK
jgi:glycosyltransferase involved in cell wall biosynthesis